MVLDLSQSDSAVGQGLDLEHVAVDDVVSSIRNSVGVRIGSNKEDIVAQSVLTEGHGLAVVIGVSRSVGQIIHLDGADGDLVGGDFAVVAIDISDVGESLAGAVGAIIDEPHLGDNAIGVDSSQIDNADQVAILILEPSLGVDFLRAVAKDELKRIIVIGTGNSVLVGIVPNDGLSAFEGLGLAEDLEVAAIDEAGILDGVGSIGVSVDQDIVALNKNLDIY